MCQLQNCQKRQKTGLSNTIQVSFYYLKYIFIFIFKKKLVPEARDVSQASVYSLSSSYSTAAPVSPSVGTSSIVIININ